MDLFSSSSPENYDDVDVDDQQQQQQQSLEDLMGGSASSFPFLDPSHQPSSLDPHLGGGGGLLLPLNIQTHYNPPPGEMNVWMLAMIGVGSSFILFVIASIYLMLKSQRETYESTSGGAAGAGGLRRHNTSGSKANNNLHHHHTGGRAAAPTAAAQGPTTNSSSSRHQQQHHHYQRHNKDYHLTQQLQQDEHL